MRKFFSDKSGIKLIEPEVTVLKVSRRSPLHRLYGPEIHLAEHEAEALGAWLADKSPIVQAEAVKAKLKPAPKSTRPPKSKPTDQPQQGA